MNCYVCGAEGSKIENGDNRVYLEDDSQRSVYVGPSCFKKVRNAGAAGLKTKSGPLVFHTKEQAIDYARR